MKDHRETVSNGSVRTSFGVNEKVVCLFFCGNVEEIQAFVQYVQKLSVLPSDIQQYSCYHSNKIQIAEYSIRKLNVQRQNMQMHTQKLEEAVVLAIVFTV